MQSDLLKSFNIDHHQLRYWFLISGRDPNEGRIEPLFGRKVHQKTSTSSQFKKRILTTTMLRSYLHFISFPI